MARLNDTAALAATPLGAELERTQRIKKIDNGYLTCESTYNPHTGEYKSSEKYSAAPPKGFSDADGARSSVGNEGLADTKKYLGGNV